MAIATKSMPRQLRRAAAGRPPTGAVVGTVRALDGRRRPLVDFPGNLAGFALPARSAVAPLPDLVGREVVLVFEQGDMNRPIILATLHDAAPRSRRRKPLRVTADGEVVTLAARTQLVLECGEASITLTRAGKVLIRGNYVLTRSTGVNSIKGGSVQIN